MNSQTNIKDTMEKLERMRHELLVLQERLLTDSQQSVQQPRKRGRPPGPAKPKKEFKDERARKASERLKKMWAEAKRVQNATEQRSDQQATG